MRRSFFRPNFPRGPAQRLGCCLRCSTTMRPRSAGGYGRRPRSRGRVHDLDKDTSGPAPLAPSPLQQRAEARRQRRQQDDRSSSLPGLQAEEEKPVPDPLLVAANEAPEEPSNGSAFQTRKQMREQRKQRRLEREAAEAQEGGVSTAATGSSSRSSMDPTPADTPRVPRTSAKEEPRQILQFPGAVGVGSPARQAHRQKILEQQAARKDEFKVRMRETFERALAQQRRVESIATSDKGKGKKQINRERIEKAEVGSH